MSLTGWLRRKWQTILRVTKQGGFVSLGRTVWQKLRQPLWVYRAEWQQAQAADSDYILVPNVNGFTMMVSSKDVGIGRELLMFRIHEPVMTNLLRAFVQQGDVVLDIGANIGYYTLLLSRWVGREGLVLAVEPHPDNFHLLEWNLQLNNVTNVKTKQVAVSDTVGTAVLFVGEGSNWHSLLPTERVTDKTIPVATVTIDALADEIGFPITLLRMDIEGMEAAALRGAEKVLIRDRPKLALELHLPYLGMEAVRTMTEWLMELGYGRCLIVPRDEEFPWTKKPPAVWERTVADFRTADKWLPCDTVNLLIEPLTHPCRLLKSG